MSSHIVNTIVAESTENWGHIVGPRGITIVTVNLDHMAVDSNFIMVESRNLSCHN